MAVATKAAAFGILLRLFDVALIDAQLTWGATLAVLATITIIVGNVGALGQSSLKRLLAWSSVAQAGYLLAGVVVGTRLGIEATLLYLAVYLVMNVAAFAVVVARERETRFGDHIDAVAGIGATRRCWPGR
jgi:NADH-quinone oxidoreductase subunit N